MEMGSFFRLGKPCSARAGSEWKFPWVPEPVVKVRSVFMDGSWWKSGLVVAEADRCGAEVTDVRGFVKIDHSRGEVDFRG